MFENIVSQSAAVQLCEDFKSGRLAPSMLFFGPAASGKGSAALELARVLSCDSSAAWNCSCPACARHRYLMHSDLLCLGKRAFSAEIAAARAAFLRESSSASTQFLLIRSLRKLLLRFSPVLWEDDSKIGKFRSVLESLEEGLAEFESLVMRPPGHAPLQENKINVNAAEKTTDALLKNALKLEAEGISDSIPIAQIRRALYWTRLAPAGKRKTLLIENAGYMQEGSRNSLLKILEEPPETLTVILCAERRELIMPTLLSRLRPYRFLKRDREKEEEVLRRVFRDSPEKMEFSGLAVYLDSFLPQTNDSLYSLAAFFIASAARAAALALRKNRIAGIPDGLNALGSYCAPIADNAGFRKVIGASDACAIVLERSAGFENLSFSQFIKNCLDLVSLAMQSSGVKSGAILYNDIWRKYTAEAQSAVSVYNQSPAQAMEVLFYRIKTAMGNCAH